MALITELEEMALSVNRVHEPATCTYCLFDEGGQRYLQIDTYGSDRRQFKGKKSQSIQLNASTARALAEIIRRNFV